MKELFEINAVDRDGHGRRESRRLRRAGMVPAVVYGASREPASVAIRHNELMQHLSHEAFHSHILSIKVDGNAERVVLREVQRHPYKRQIMHVDLLRIAEDRMLVMNVPLHFSGEDVCVGVRQEGGVIAHLATEVEIACLPKDLPEYLEIDVSNLALGSSLHLSDIPLPEGVSIPGLERGEDVDSAVVNVFIPRVVEEAAAEEAEPEDEEAGAEDKDAEGTAAEGQEQSSD